MPKRYGRNKKRKHREQIAKLTEDNLNLNKAIISSNQKRNYVYNKFEDFIKEFNKWWQNSVLTSPNIENINYKLPPSFKMAVYKPIEAETYSLQRRHAFDVVDLSRQLLYALEVAVKEDIGQRHMHFILRTEGDVYSYYVDPRMFDTFRGMPEEVFKRVCWEFKMAFNKKYGDRYANLR